MSLELPLLFWNDPPENYDITCAYLTDSRLVIGTEQSYLILYYIKRVKICQPFAILKGHDSAVRDLTKCVYNSAKSVISVCQSGTICIWNLTDGRCMLTIPHHVHPNPSQMVFIPEFSKIVVCSESNSIEIFDLNNPTEIHTLQGHSDYVTAISGGVFRNNYSMLFSGSKDQTFRTWVMKPKKRKYSRSIPNHHHHHQYQSLNFFSRLRLFSSHIVKLSEKNQKNQNKPSPEILSISNTDCLRTILLVYSEKWELYRFGDFDPFFVMPNVSDTEFYKGGFFINEWILFLFTDQGNGFLYKLPKLDSSVGLVGHNILGNEIYPPSSSSSSSSSSSPCSSDEEIEGESNINNQSNKTSQLKKLNNNKINNNNDKKSKTRKIKGITIFEERMEEVNKSNRGKLLVPKVLSFPNTSHEKLVTLEKPSDFEESESRNRKNSKKVKNNEEAINRKSQSPIDLKQMNEKLSSSLKKKREKNRNKRRENFFRKQLKTQTSPPPSSPPAMIARFDYRNPEKQELGTSSTIIWKCYEEQFLVRIIQSHSHATVTKTSNNNSNDLKLKFSSKGEREEENQHITLWKLQFQEYSMAQSVGVKEIEVKSIKENWCHLSHQKNRRKRIREIKREISKSMKTAPSVASINKVEELLTEFRKPRNINISDNDITSEDFFYDRELGTFLVYGYSNGSIEILSIFHKPIEIQKAHEKCVSCVLLMKDDFLDRLVLISGSKDTTVKVWNLKKVICKNNDQIPAIQLKFDDPKKRKRILLKTFQFHSQGVRELFLPSQYFRKKLSNGFCSLGEDHSIVVYSLKYLECVHVLGGHSSPILDVFWRVDLDYLLVQCLDTTIFAWHVSTGLLERRVSGILAKDLLERSEGGKSFRRQFGKEILFRGKIDKGVSFDDRYNSDNSEEISSFLNPIFLPRIGVLGMGLQIRKVVDYIVSKREMYRSFVRKENQSILQLNKEYSKIPLGKNQPKNTPPISQKDGDAHFFSHFVKYIPETLRAGLCHLFKTGGSHTLSLLRKLLGIDQYYLDAHIGIKGSTTTLYESLEGISKKEHVYTLFLPKERFHEFRFSPVLSAGLVVSMISVLNALSYFPEIRQLCVESKQYILDRLCSCFPGPFEHPSFLWCSQFLKDSNKEIQVAARSVMGATLNKLSLSEKKEMAKQLASVIVKNNPSILKDKRMKKDYFDHNKIISPSVSSLSSASGKSPLSAPTTFRSNPSDKSVKSPSSIPISDKLAPTTLNDETSGDEEERSKIFKNLLDVNKLQNVVVSLAVLGCKNPRAMDRFIASITCNGLIEIMKSGGSQHMTAISLLGEGYRMWQYYVDSPGIIIRELFTLSLPTLTKRDTKIDPDSLSVDSYKAFLNIALIDSKMYISFLHDITKNSSVPLLTLCAAIKTMSPLIDIYPEVLVDHLVVVISFLLKLLNPSRARVRETTTFIFRKMVAKFPMISFHQSNQKLAVGNKDGIVVIYDMQTTDKWQLFEAHDGPVRAIQFNPNGKWLASYSPNDFMCKIWNVDTGGMLNLLGVATRSIKNFRVVFSDPKQPVDQIIKHVYIKWDLKNLKKFILCPGRDLQKILFSV